MAKVSCILHHQDPLFKASLLNKLVKGHFVNCFSGINTQYSDICWKNVSSFCKSYSHVFSKKFQHICVSLNVNFNESLTNDVVSFEQLGPGVGQDLVAGKGRGRMLLFLLFLPFYSCYSFFPVPLFYLLYYLFSPFLWETTQNDPQGLTFR